MAENEVQIVIRAQDQASRQIQALGEQFSRVEQAGKRMGASLQATGERTLSVSRQFSALSATTRFAAASVLTELNPALGLAVTRMSGLATVGASTGSVLRGALVVGGIGLVATALASWIRRTNEQIEAQQKLNRQVASFDVAGIQGSISSLSAELDLAIAKSETFFGSWIHGFQNMWRILTGTSTRIGELRKNIDEAGEAFERIRPQQFQAELAGVNAEQEKLIQAIHRHTVATSENIAEVREGGAALEQSSDKEAKLQAARLEFEQKVAVERARTARLGEAEIERLELLFAERRENLLLEFGNRKVEIVRQTNERVKTIVGEAEREAEAAAQEGTRRAGERIDKVFEEIKKQQDHVERIMTSLGNAAADALFDGLIGRSRNLGEAFKSFFEGLARDVFRNTLTQLVGGKTQGLTLKNLLSLGGGGGPFGRATALAAAVPGAGQFGIPGLTPEQAGVLAPGGGIFGGFQPGTAAEIEARGAGGLLADGGGLGLGQIAGGLAGVGIGALGILGASQAQDPLSGALSGGLGGLSAGLGLASLGLGASAVLGPIGLVAGLAFGLISGASGRRKRKQEEARRRRAEAQIALIQAADTLEELEALSVIGLEPEAQAALRQQATPLVLEAGRREIAETRSLSGIEAILARGVSPDVGVPELRAEAERRRQEILGGLEQIGGIAIEEEIEGGIRRRTIVGAGPFGLARIGPGDRVTADASRIRRMIRMMLLEDQALREELMRRMRSDAQAIDFRIGDLDSLS